MRTALQDRTAAAILEAATRLLAERGDATMADVADAAGVGRTTLYRYFPTREDLIESLRAAALAEAAERLAAAGLATCEPGEGIARAMRALLTVGDRYVVLTRERAADPRVAERRLGRPIRKLLVRARSAGMLRADLPDAVLLAGFGGALSAGIRLMSRDGFGLEDASAYATRLFLDGTGRR
jgi:AcrR family transcriptional regulator